MIMKVKSYASSFSQQSFNCLNIFGSFSNRSNAVIAAWANNGGADAEKQ